MADVLIGGVALVTGAASGIGASLSIALARTGCNLALIDIDVEGLAVVATRAREHGVRVTTHVPTSAMKKAVTRKRPIF